MEQEQQPQTGFQKLLLSMMNRRWLMTLIVLITFMSIAFGILLSIHSDSVVSGEWKELLLLLLGALIGSYGKIIDYWFSDTDKDKMLVQKMDEEDGVSLSDISK
jgi:ABC-type lipoprotein release transport system permease subunit